MDVFFQELKRQLNFKRILTYILIAITLAVLWTWFIVGGATEGFMQTGCYKAYKGRAAIEVAARDRNPTSGEMTEDKFQKGCDVFLNSLKSDDESDVVITKEFLQYAVYADNLVMQELVLRNMRGESTKGLAHIPKDAGKNFYKNEDLYYHNYIEKNAQNESEKALALSMWDKVKKPYIYYSGYGTWGDGISHIVFLSFILIIMVVIFAGSIIAKDKETGLDEIIVTTVKGKKNLIIAKTVIPWIMAVIIYLCGVGVYVILLKKLLPANALNTSMQVLGRSLVPYKASDLLIKRFILGGVGILTMASFSTLISSIVKKSSRAIQISILTILAAFSLFAFIDMNNPIINIIKILLPGEVIFSDVEAVRFPIITFMGKAFFVPLVSVIVSGIIFVLSTILTSLNYVRR